VEKVDFTFSWQQMECVPDQSAGMLWGAVESGVSVPGEQPAGPALPPALHPRLCGRETSWQHSGVPTATPRETACRGGKSSQACFRDPRGSEAAEEADLRMLAGEQAPRGWPLASL